VLDGYPAISDKEKNMPPNEYSIILDLQYYKVCPE